VQDLTDVLIRKASRNRRSHFLVKRLVVPHKRRYKSAYAGAFRRWIPGDLVQRALEPRFLDVDYESGGGNMASSDFQVTGKNTKALFTLKLHRGDGMCLVAMNWKKGQPPKNFVGFAIESKRPTATRFSR
jgi:hypothetical protein